tara:strand:- start:24 stop:1433 length:1410 start_codon:yes stop_codon:yes gene_type:complete
MKREHKIGVGISVSVILILIIIYILKKSGDEPVASKPPASRPPTELPVDAPTEVVEAVNKLEEIKGRIANAENYREYYRSETNNGLTIVGTLMEQMIDVMVTVLKQPLVSEAISKRVVSKQDADEIAEYIEFLGKEIVKEVEQTPLLRCGRPMVEKCREGNGVKECWSEEGEGDVPEDNCEVYKFNEDKVEEGTKRAAVNLYNKVLSVVEKAEERDKMYRITKNISIDNYKQYALSSGREISVAQIENFPEQGRLENIAMAHYKYLGHELKKELGDSVNVRELTEEETPFIEYMRQQGPPSKSIEPPVASISMFKDCEESEEGLVKKISINQWQIDEDVIGEMTSEDGEKIKRIVLSNIQLLPGSHFVKQDGVNEERVDFEVRQATGVFFDCEGRTDVYAKNVNLKFKIKPVKEGFLIEENDTLTHRQVSEGIQNVGNAGSMQVSEEIQNVEDAGQVSEGIQNVESYRI